MEYEPKLEMLLSETEFTFEAGDVDAIMAYLDHDKKNNGGRNGFVLLKAVEKPLVDQFVPEELVRESLEGLSLYLKSK